MESLRDQLMLISCIRLIDLTNLEKNSQVRVIKNWHRFYLKNGLIWKNLKKISTKREPKRVKNNTKLIKRHSLNPKVISYRKAKQVVRKKEEINHLQKLMAMVIKRLLEIKTEVISLLWNSNLKIKKHKNRNRRMMKMMRRRMKTMKMEMRRKVTRKRMRKMRRDLTLDQLFL